MKITVIAVILLFLAQIALSVQVGGKAFDWETLGGVPAIIRFSQNGSLEAQVIAGADGNYSAEIRPGTYSVFAYYGTLEYEENLTLVKDVRLEIGLLPALSEVFPNLTLPETAELNNTIEALDEMPENATPALQPQRAEQGQDILPYILPVIVVPILVFLYLRRKGKPRIIGDEEAVLGIIREKGSVLQSEINGRTGFSEAKTSLIIKSLVSRGLAKKEKKGRENVISANR